MVLIIAILVMFTTVVIVGKLQMRRGGEAANLGSMSREWVAEYRHASDAAAEKR
jgi:hypothetical protein